MSNCFRFARFGFINARLRLGFAAAGIPHDIDASIESSQRTRHGVHWRDAALLTSSPTSLLPQRIPNLTSSTHFRLFEQFQPLALLFAYPFVSTKQLFNMYPEAGPSRTNGTYSASNSASRDRWEGGPGGYDRDGRDRDGYPPRADVSIDERNPGVMLNLVAGCAW